MLVYIAGKYRGKNSNEVWHNIMLAREYGEKVALQGHMPVIPHMNGMFMDGIQDDQFWLDGTLELMRRCDAILLLPNWQDSVGAKSEWHEAQRIGLQKYELP